MHLCAGVYTSGGDVYEALQNFTTLQRCRRSQLEGKRLDSLVDVRAVVAHVCTSVNPVLVDIVLPFLRSMINKMIANTN